MGDDEPGSEVAAPPGLITLPARPMLKSLMGGGYGWRRARIDDPAGVTCDVDPWRVAQIVVNRGPGHSAFRGSGYLVALGRGVDSSARCDRSVNDTSSAGRRGGQRKRSGPDASWETAHIASKRLTQ